MKLRDLLSELPERLTIQQWRRHAQGLRLDCTLCIGRGPTWWQRRKGRRRTRHCKRRLTQRSLWRAEMVLEMMAARAVSLWWPLSHCWMDVSSEACLSSSTSSCWRMEGIVAECTTWTLAGT
ncbi:hypothetical protein H310_05164 [Aphanomyces invadans]|uniref:Uncharacterized protein n=1 Tax=Aphanomyces invadans TaxID=157072 RepID=A0A024UBZ1_9STRA|nr:hypothetical protein H310_05164 [Aphanomyces invadans]ETW03799.1 hypothetical protein H310_05164 [Aphanomyces invadans]|eukprot:XP_008868028.1 hypothetical protein H310_05164 [Aphanomyces invadans]